MGIEKHRVFAQLGKCRWRVWRNNKTKNKKVASETESLWVLEYTKTALRRCTLIKATLNNYFGVRFPNIYVKV